MKHIHGFLTAAAILICALCVFHAAHAESAPCGQSGCQGWPDRQPAAPYRCTWRRTNCSGDWNCPDHRRCRQVYSTPRPTSTPFSEKPDNFFFPAPSGTPSAPHGPETSAQPMMPGAPTLDPAVFFTAIPLQAEASSTPPPEPSPDPAVYYTAIPSETPGMTAAPAPTAPPTWRPAPTQAPSAPTAAPSRMPTTKPTVKPTARPTAAPTIAPSFDTGHYTSDYALTQEQKALNLLNEDRAANGLPPLALDAELSNLARLKSCDMNANHYFAHESPTYGNAGSMLNQFGYDYNGVGENIAHHATVEKAEAAFLSSPGHRINMMGSQWTKVGIGVCIDENGFVYLTQIFVR